MSSCHGAGLGLRFPHIKTVLSELPAVPWFEVHICNFLGGGLNRALLHQVREHYPLSFHGVNLNLGGVDPLDTVYLNKLKQAIREYEPALVSEHACFTALEGHHFHDLMPVPYTAEAVAHMAARIRQVQETLERTILLENVSRYYTYPESDLTEGQFLAAVSEMADCDLLLDINNAYVNRHNLDESLEDFIRALPRERIREIHLAGFSQEGARLIDTHGSAVSEAVWQAFKCYCPQLPGVPCLIEWDNNLPDFSVLMAQRMRAESILNDRQKTVKTRQCQL
jgi:uncharacterized protein (UPF0276 family)